MAAIESGRKTWSYYIMISSLSFYHITDKYIQPIHAGWPDHAAMGRISTEVIVLIQN